MRLRDNRRRALRPGRKSRPGNPLATPAETGPAGSRRVQTIAPATVYDTLQEIDREVLRGSGSPIVRDTAISIARRAGPWWDAWTRLYSLDAWVRSYVEYQPDPSRIEWLQTASNTLSNPTAGADCDDFVILGRAMLESIGYETTSGLAGDNGPEHVFALARFPGWSNRWWPVDFGGAERPGRIPRWRNVWLPERVIAEGLADGARY